MCNSLLNKELGGDEIINHFVALYHCPVRQLSSMKCMHTDATHGLPMRV